MLCDDWRIAFVVALPVAIVFILKVADHNTIKKMNSSLSFMQVAVKICLPWASLSLLFSDLQLADDLRGV